MPKLPMDGKRHVGDNLVTLVVRTWDREGGRNPILILLRAATTEPKAAEMLTEFVRSRLFAPLWSAWAQTARSCGATLASSQLSGLGLARHVPRAEPVASAKPKDVVAWYAPYLTGKLW